MESKAVGVGALATMGVVPGTVPGVVWDVIPKGTPRAKLTAIFGAVRVVVCG